MLALAVSVLVLGFITVAGAAALAGPPVEEESIQGGHWLEVINGYRQMAGLKPVGNSAELSSAATELAGYHLANQSVGQDGADPNMSLAEAEAAAHSDVIGSADPDTTDRMFIDRSMSSPFHAVGLLQEDLVSVGYGSADDPRQADVKAVAVMDVGRGRSDPLYGPPARRVWPPEGSVVPLLEYAGGSVPNPIDGCTSQFEAPTGTPIIVWWPRPVERLTARMWVNGARQSTCILRSTPAAVSAGSAVEAMVRRVLGTTIAIVIPEKKLPSNATVRVSVDSPQVESFEWTFHTAEPGSPIGLDRN